MCPLICYDLRFPVWSRNADNAYDLLLYVANWPDPRRNAWTTLLEARAIENLSYVVGVNRVGTDGNDRNYAGDSRAIDFKGGIVADAGSEPGRVTATLASQPLHDFRSRFPAHLDADAYTLDGVGPMRSLSKR